MFFILSVFVDGFQTPPAPIACFMGYASYARVDVYAIQSLFFTFNPYLFSMNHVNILLYLLT